MHPPRIDDTCHNLTGSETNYYNYLFEFTELPPKHHNFEAKAYTPPLRTPCKKTFLIS